MTVNSSSSSRTSRSEEWEEGTGPVVCLHPSVGHGYQPCRTELAGSLLRSARQIGVPYNGHGGFSYADLLHCGRKHCRRRPASIDCEHAAGHITRGFAGQKDRRSPDLLQPSPAIHRNRVTDKGLKLFDDRLIHGREKRPRTEGVAGDAVRTCLHSVLIRPVRRPGYA